MSSPLASSSVVQALASSSKGRLQYDREWHFSKANTSVREPSAVSRTGKKLPLYVENDSRVRSGTQAVLTSLSYGQQQMEGQIVPETT